MLKRLQRGIYRYRGKVLVAFNNRFDYNIHLKVGSFTTWNLKGIVFLNVYIENYRISRPKGFLRKRNMHYFVAKDIYIFRRQN